MKAIVSIAADTEVEHADMANALRFLAGAGKNWRVGRTPGRPIAAPARRPLIRPDSFATRLVRELL